MKTKKERTIKAIKSLIKRYKDILEIVQDILRIVQSEGIDSTSFMYTFGRKDHCPLCKIHFKTNLDCKGCPQAGKYGNIGCVNTKSYTILDNYFKLSIEEKEEALINRINYHKKLLEIVKTKPDSQFTKKGWKYLKEIERIE